MDIYHLETLTVSLLSEEALELANHLGSPHAEWSFNLPQLLNEEEMAVFAKVGQSTLYHP
ncbi:MAG: hypothetical protein P4L87_23160 [Formivibrio sp.]|nr:hypothetical protein [Formivibrio sp.]